MIRKRTKDIIELNVKPSTDRNRYKDNIITALYNNGIILNKIRGILSRHKVYYGAQIDEDLNQLTFLELCKKSPDEIIEMYEDDPSRLVGLCVRIAVLKGVAKGENTTPKHNLCDWILHFSAFNIKQKTENKDLFNNTLIDLNTEDTNYNEDYETELLELILKVLDERGLDILTAEPNKIAAIKKILRITLININNKTRMNILTPQQIERLEQVIPIIKEWHRTRLVQHITTEEIELIAKAYNIFYPQHKLVLSCGSCIKDAMDLIDINYNRYKKNHANPGIELIQKQEVEEMLNEAIDEAENVIKAKEEKKKKAATSKITFENKTTKNN